MFVNMRRFRKYNPRLIVMFFATLLIMLNWESIDNRVLGHVKSYTYRYLYNSFQFINTSIRVSPEEAIRYSNHKYILNHENKCGAKDILLLLFVKSSSQNFERRHAIRATWGNVVYVENTFGVTIKVLFALGVHPEQNNRKLLHQQLILENKKYKDLIQQDFIDTFHNLTLKLLLQLSWKESYCRHAHFFMSTDDDVFIHIPNLIRYLQEIARNNNKNLWIGRVHRGSPPVRDKTSKYYVSQDMYSWLSYPDYTPGSGYVLSKDAATKIYQASCTLNASLHIDDVFLGICAKIMDISPKDNVFFSGEGKAHYHCCIYNQMITSHGHVSDIYELWGRVTDPLACQISSGLFSRLYCTLVKVRLLCVPFGSYSYPCKAAFE
ncbi:Lactosylceramide 1,3-N-acetyl-beta-D-glucosaminyltransferase B [Triplophysa tibetana]|uniref:Hexosyltransferase n=1 Tax=Triplophysa tibetana TaxID=1572043 RepID=A0A5A9PCM3_9TELE|nr:Lactosylceramide 1,3-N-acetyl-beta-D-glucosaminyltransferase B [Triplophysa tibetana]